MINGNKYNAVDRKFKILSPNLWFDEPKGQFCEGYATIKVNGKGNWIDKNGSVLYPNIWFNSVGDFYNGYANFLYDGVSGRVNIKGDVIWNP